MITTPQKAMLVGAPQNESLAISCKAIKKTILMLR